MKRRRPWGHGSPHRARGSAILHRMAGVLFGAALLTGCGDLTSGGFGEVEVEVFADTLNLTSAAALQGTLTVELQIYLSRGSGEIELTEGPQLLELPLDGSASALLPATSVPVGRYAGGRLVFRAVSAEIEGGLLVGGVPFVGTAALPLPAGETIDLPWAADFRAEGRERAHLVLEIRATRWLRLLNGETGEVSRESFEANPPRVRPAP